MQAPANMRITDTPMSQQQIYEWMLQMRHSAYTPGSSFQVCSVVRVEDNQGRQHYFAGVNTESAEERLSIHGEEGAISAAFTAFGPVEISEIWTLGASQGLEPQSQDAQVEIPCYCCGKCCQQLTIMPPQAAVHNFALNGEVETMTASQQLAKEFGYRNFKPSVLQDLVKPPSLKADDLAAKLVRPAKAMTPEKIQQWMQELQSVNYNRPTNHVSIIQRGDKLYAGVEIQDAAYIGISATQAAVTISQADAPQAQISRLWTNHPLFGGEKQFLAEHRAQNLQIEQLNATQEWEKQSRLAEEVKALPTYGGQKGVAVPPR